jgi:hypothetical protein
LGAKLAVAYEVSQAPAITPDPTSGAPLYAQHCSVCHGNSGAGDGPAGVGLTPPPANLRDAARLDRLSLYAIYNTLGVARLWAAINVQALGAQSAKVTWTIIAEPEDTTRKGFEAFVQDFADSALNNVRKLLDKP